MKKNGIACHLSLVAAIFVVLTACNGHPIPSMNVPIITPVIATPSMMSTPEATLTIAAPTSKFDVEYWLASQNPVSGVAWSTDAKTIIVSANSGVYMFDAQTGRLVHSFAEGNFLFPFAVDSQNERLFAGNRVWDVLSGELLHQLTQQNIGPVTFSPDGKTLAISDGSTVTLLNAATGQTQRSMGNELGDALLGLAYRADGTMLYTVSSDLKVRGVNLLSGQFTQSFSLPAGSCCTLFSPDSKYLVVNLSSHGAGSKQLWDVEQGTLIVDTGNCDNDVWFSAFSPDSTKFVVGLCSFDAQVWDTRTQQMIHKIPSATMLTSSLILASKTGLNLVPPEWRSAALNYDGSKIAFGNNFGEILIWDVDKDQLSGRIPIP
jgi:WD40 repeat protein